jgi:CRP/FNR family cyclic AMP-dependent transcriptional regulator
MSRKDAYLDHLHAVPMFRGLTRKHLEVVGKQGTTVDVPAGRAVIREGEHGEEFFVVISGKLSVTAGGKEFAVLGEGDFFGELALFDPAPRDATVTADTDSQLLVIGAQQFAPLLEDVPSLARKVAQVLARRLREADRQRLLQ